MHRPIKFLFILFALCITVSCNKKEFDDYYGRPDDLEDPVYQELEKRGRFSSFLKAIDKAGYKDILGTSGYWTVFAPDDEAFSAFLREEGMNDVEDIDSVTAGKIVRYSLVYNAFRTDRISDYQSSTGWEPDLAFKRRTAYYDGFQNVTVNGAPMIITGSNRNNNASGDYYISGDNNNKYIAYFKDDFLDAQQLSPNDYNYFYPDTEFTGFNVLDASVNEVDIIAENGIIHEVEKVLLPRPNFDQYLRENEQYGLFYQMLEDNLVSYIYNTDATKTYRNYTGNGDEVYVKVYDPALAFSLNNENFLKEMDNDAQADGYTMFVPENNTLQEFINTVLLKHYPSLNALPKYIFEDFFNAHMWQSTVWPSRFDAGINFLKEEARFDKDADIEESKVLSNGLFYGTNKVQHSNLFFTVYTAPYLDPAYTLMTRALNDGDGYKEVISNIARKFTLFMMSDELLRSLGYDYDTIYSEWVYTSPQTGNTVRGNLAKSRLLRVLYNHIVLTPNGELDDLSGSGIIRSGDLDIPGEYIKYDNNTVYAAGNEDLENVVHITGYEDFENGRAYYTDNLIEFSEETVGMDLDRLAAAEGSEFSSFYNYLSNSLIYDPGAGSIVGVELGTSYTFLVPDNAAIQQAVDDGILPGTETESGMEPNYNPDNLTEKEQVSKFIQYHILSTKTVSDDGNITGAVPTLFKDELGENLFINVISSPGELQFTDANQRTAGYIPSQSNLLADRALIHLIDNYLSYAE